MDESPDDLALSTTIEVSGEAFKSEQNPSFRASADLRPVLRSDLPLPTQDEMADDGGAAALIARSRKLSDRGES